MFKKILCATLLLILLSYSSACDRTISDVPETSRSTGNDENEKKVLTVSVLFPQQISTTGIELFEDKHKNISIEIVDYEKNREKYLMDLRTSLMAGKGYDLISLYGVPYRPYAEKGLFADLSDWMESDRDFHFDEYYSGAFDVYKHNNRIFAVPLTVNLEMISASGKALDTEGIRIDDKAWSLKDFVEIAIKVTKDFDGDGITDQYALPNLDLEYFLQFLLKIDAFLDFDKNKAFFNTPEFIESLKLLKMLQEEGCLNPNITSVYQLEEKAEKTGVVFLTRHVTGYYRMNALRKIFGTDVRFLRMPSPNTHKGGYFCSESILAMNERSPYKEEAWELIECLLSAKVQGQEDGSGFPPMSLHVKTNIHAKENKASANYVDLADQFMKEIRFETYSYYDDRFAKVVLTEVQHFMDGFMTAEEAAKAIQSRMELYLQE